MAALILVILSHFPFMENVTQGLDKRRISML